jgi:H+/Na+-translocating ferredoxin:NAD+ oxidoreductase subunit B
MKNLYEKLRDRLDTFSSGYPKTESGIELRILKKLFNDEEAILILELYPLLETAESVAKRLNRDPEATNEILDTMAKKGLLFRHNNGICRRYCAVPFVPGIYDFQLNAMDREFAKLINDYTEEGFGRTIQGHQTPILRTIPMNRKLVAEWPIAPYEDAIGIIDEQDTIAVAPCICRTKSGLLDESCGKPVETCLQFGHQADYYVANQMGRFISREEAKTVLKKSDEAGLVIQPFNSQKIGVMCSCCGDCCEMLGSLKKQPSPAAAVKSNYFAVVNADLCIGCDTCVDRCQIESITLLDNIAVIDLNRCIGCGLCASTCPTEAMKLVKKEESELYQPPESVAAMFTSLAAQRGKSLFS